MLLIFSITPQGITLDPLSTAASKRALPPYYTDDNDDNLEMHFDVKLGGSSWVKLLKELLGWSHMGGDDMHGDDDKMRGEDDMLRPDDGYPWEDTDADGEQYQK